MKCFSQEKQGTRKINKCKPIFMPTRVEHLWAMHFILVPLIDFNLGKYDGQDRVMCGKCFSYIGRSLTHCLQLGNLQVNDKRMGLEKGCIENEGETDPL
jgi:hypothetical protein